MIFFGKRQSFKISIVVSFTIFLQVSSCLALPISQENTEKNKSSPGASSLIPFLKKFGYLENNENTSSTQSEHDHDMLYTEDSVEEAIKEMQKFGGLKQTGRLDNETLSLLTRPRCGIQDVFKHATGRRSKRYVIGASGWNKRRLSYRVENWTPQLDESAVMSDIRKAFDTWADYARLRFVNTPRSSHDDVDISISFGRGYHGDSYVFDGPSGVLAHAFFPYGHGTLGGDIHFDLDENWHSSKAFADKDKESREDGGSAYPVSFLLVAIHEIGHSLGLSHSPSTDSVMFPYYQGFGEDNTENVRLGYDDIMAMYRLYIQREIHDYGDDVSTTESYTTQQTPTSTDSSSSDSPLTTHKYDITTEKTVDDRSNGSIPNLCIDGFDTITFIRNELFVFKGKYMWRFKERGLTEHIYPVQTSRLFPMLADNNKVDAAFENDDGQLLFFSGKNYWTYDGVDNVNLFPLTNFGLPADVDKIDAAFIWGKNRKLYFFSDNLFWRFDTANKIMDEGYPKGIERWKGLPQTGINSALRWSDGLTYFFNNDDFWRFDDTNVRTDEGFPMRTSSYWFGC